MTLEWSVRRTALAALTLAVVATDGSAQASELVGRLVSDSGAPIRGATITVTSIRYSVRTDSLGRFRLAGTPGSTLNLMLTAPGFRDDTASVVLPRRRSIERDFKLASDQAPLPEANPSDRVLRGRVVTVSGEGVSYANVLLNGGRRFVTDDSGQFTVPFAAGSHTLLFRRIGFAPEEVKLDAMPDTTIRVRLSEVARVLPGQVVSGRSQFVRLGMGGFYKRMQEVQRGARVGYFVTPEDLALRNPQNVTDAVQQFPNIRLRPIDDGKIGSDGMNHGDGMPLSRKFRIEDLNGCPFTVYLDRVRVVPSIVGMKAVDEEINSLVRPHSVAGIEVYPRGLSTPPEFPPFNQGTMCPAGGVILIWTR